uniref:Reverse transcriptase domain-containing protein n=1 Tax=Tanacetum cinerariifolium TaxID=118510 RepID=A0A699QGT5_TANCI|nr:reverse transcriptase domain-containing protein [Tanacetum cinerariifolium]
MEYIFNLFKPSSQSYSPLDSFEVVRLAVYKLLVRVPTSRVHDSLVVASSIRVASISIFVSILVSFSVSIVLLYLISCQRLSYTLGYQLLNGIRIYSLSCGWHVSSNQKEQKKNKISDGLQDDVSVLKYEASVLLDGAMTWWNSHVKTVGIDAAYDMSWRELMKMMTKVYYLQNEIHKLENDLWNLTVKGIDVVSYTQRFQELALLCLKIVLDE